MKKTKLLTIISLVLIIALLFVGCGNAKTGKKGDENSKQTSTNSSTQTTVSKQNLRLNTVTKATVGYDGAGVYHYKYYEDYIECALSSNIFWTIYYDKELKTAYLGNYTKTIDDVKNGEWTLSVTYDENDKIVSFCTDNSTSACTKINIDYTDDKQILFNLKRIYKNTGVTEEDLGKQILEYQDNKMLFYSEKNKDNVTEYVLKNNKIASYTNMISGETYEHTFEYDKVGELSEATKKSSKYKYIYTFSYSESDDFKIWYNLATVSNLTTLTDMMVYLLNMQ